jgi:hypothetical protein
MERWRLPVQNSNLTFGVCGALLAFALSASAQGNPSFSKGFSPSTIGPGSVSTLTFSIINTDPVNPVTDLAFTDTLPAGVVLATPAVGLSSCGGTLAAPDGGATVSFNDGVLSAASSCSIVVDVTSATVGTHMNVSGALTSSAGNSGTATADLTVATSRPAFTKSFAPDSIRLNARSTLTFTIDNSANPGFASSLTFTDPLPPGMVVAGPANAVTDCTGATVSAVPDSSSIALVGGLLLSGQSCSVTVDVVGQAVGMLDNQTAELTSSPGGPSVSSGHANASLEATVDPLALAKSFTDDPVNPGGTVTLEFTVTNFNRDNPATLIAFADDLDATLSGLVAVGLPAADVCGAGSTLSGTTLLTLTGGTLPPGGSCSFSVPLQVPPGATAGSYLNTTGLITADVGGASVTGSPATETLFVNDAPLLTKTFLTNPIGAGNTVTTEFTITNPSVTSAAIDITFTDNLSAFLSGTTVTALPTNGSCGAVSTFGTLLILDDLHLRVTGAQLPAGGSCTFSFGLSIPSSALPGPALNSTSEISATVDGTTQTAKPATDTLTVVGAPRLRKEFTDDPVAPGGTVTLEFTISHDENASGDATAIAFTDDLAAVLTGLTAVGLPAADVCGIGSSLAGTGTLSLTGGALAPGESCTFAVTVQVPAAAVPGTYFNLTSEIAATVSGVTATGSPASSDLRVSGIDFTKVFVDDPVIPGGAGTLRFTIGNTTTSSNATGITFTDNLNATLTGLAAVGPLPTTPCGAGSVLVGTSNLIFTGGALAAGEMCTFDISVTVPGSAMEGTYVNTTSNLTAIVGGSAAVIDPTTASLEVSGERMSLTKAFLDDPVSPGDTVTLRFTLTNLDPAQSATGITFTDDLDAALSGLTAVDLPATSICGAGSQLTGTSLLTFTGGALPPAGACSFDVTLQVPAATAPGAASTNVTSQVTGTIGGLAVTGPAGQDDLLINFAALSKSFAGSTKAGGSVLLTFTLENLSSTNTAGGLSFLDDLDAMLQGAIAIDLPATDVCGPGSSIDGTSVIALRDGVLGPDASCTFSVEVSIPATATPGAYVNTTSGISAAGATVGEPTAATIEVEPAAIAAAIPAQTPMGLLALIFLLAGCGLWLLRARVF